MLLATQHATAVTTQPGDTQQRLHGGPQHAKGIKEDAEGCSGTKVPLVAGRPTPGCSVLAGQTPAGR